MIPVLLACSGPSEPPGTIPPFTWTDTGVLATWDEALVFDGEPPRNLLMISIDTLRKDALGRYGGSGTPTLDALLAGGVALDDHLQCANWTYAATTCTLLGAYPEDLRVWPQLRAVPVPLPGGLPFLAGLLGEQGFHPILVTTNTWLSPMVNNVQGYAELSLPEDQDALDAWAAGARLVEDALARGEDRWFLHVHLKEPHQPYAPPESYLADLAGLEPAPWDLTDFELVYDVLDDWPDLSPEEQALLEAHLRVRYAGEVRWLDDQLAALLADLDARGWREDTLLVVWTDHGESFWEHGHGTHAWTLHAEENDGIALFHAPNLAPVAWTGPTSAIDLVPTLLAVWDLPVPDSVEGLVLGSAAPGRARFAATDARSGVEQHVVKDGWKLRYHWSGKAQLYDRGADAGELDDRWAAGDPVAQQLWETLGPRTEAIRPLASEAPVTPPGW